ncbi:MAG: hypothetical protein V1770_04415 [bacterium]
MSFFFFANRPSLSGGKILLADDEDAKKFFPKLNGNFRSEVDSSTTLPAMVTGQAE